MGGNFQSENDPKVDALRANCEKSARENFFKTVTDPLNKYKHFFEIKKGCHRLCFQAI
jgi:hypothetical protein